MQGTGKNRSEFWKQELERFSSSGLTAQAYCASRGLGYSSFCGWRRRLEGVGDHPQLVTIPVISPRSAPPQRSDAGMICVEFEGVRLNLPSTTDPHWLAAVLVALQSDEQVGRC